MGTGGSIPVLAEFRYVFCSGTDTTRRAQYGTIHTDQMDAKQKSRLNKFMHFSNRLCFYGIGLLAVFFLVAYHTSATLFSFDSDLLPISGTLFALIAVLLFSIDRTMELQAREIEIARRFAQVFFALAEEGQALGSADKRGHTRAAAEKIEELKENLRIKIIKGEKHLRSEWRFVVVSIVTVLLGFQAVLSSLKH
ncbi:MAG TPA: hypothetical protein VEG60_22965 [Candidatus Binatia bacterium]|nr:hypothetical protein [Candidatus Binatia bacterium]